ncbi:MAG: IPT/TIG domain-containing protein, partial [Cyanobacteria bacterium REEB65]|nr:IPT/TIG domain-containing protein [Cyanobacteria bacterium REEB65]
QPAVQSVYPPSGVPGTTVVIFGSNFGATQDTSYSVQLGSTAIANPVRVNDNILDFTMPANAPPGFVTVDIGGATASLATLVSPIASVSLSTSSVQTFQPFSELQFSAQAVDVNGKAIADPNVVYTLAGAPSADFGALTPNGMFTSGYQEGSATIVVGSGNVSAAAPITTHPVNQADALAAGLAALPATDSYPNYYPPTDPFSSAKVSLGKALFGDPLMSGTQTISCASCHKTALGMADGLPVAITNKSGESQHRAAPTLLNVGFMGAGAAGVTFPGSVFMFWDGRADNLEDQAQAVFDNPNEIDNPSTDSVTTYLKGSSYYVDAFGQAFGPGSADDQNCSGASCISMPNVREAIATFERSMVTPGASFDIWINEPVGTDPAHAMSASALVGLGTFLGQGHCVQCHNGPTFSDDQFHNVGAGIPPGVTDLGRGAISGNAADNGKFKTPTLRNIALTAPYFHAGLDFDGGTVNDLDSAVKHYEGVSSTSGLDPKLPRVFNPDDTQEQGVVDFLTSLTGATPSVLQ